MNLIHTFIEAYDNLEHKWHSIQKSKWISNIVITFFITGITLSIASQFNLTSIKFGKFFAIELSFSVLLLIEVFDLFFIISKSVADSVCKQFEIISLILLRSAFKELGHLPLNIAWDLKSFDSLLPIIVDALGAVVIFFITVVFYRKQKHIQITSTDIEKQNFVIQKKIVASFMLLFFLLQIIYSIWLFISSQQINQNLFTQLYTALIFADILILIISLRYSNLYVHLFRYSSFALATVILRLSLSAPKYINVVFCISSGLFILLVSESYNYLNKKLEAEIKM